MNGTPAAASSPRRQLRRAMSSSSGSPSRWLPLVRASSAPCSCSAERCTWTGSGSMPGCAQAFRVREAPWWGIQFHAEATSETIAGWIRDYRSDEDAARANLDWEAILLETRRQIGRWNELGVGICSRFLDHATGA